MVVCQQFFFISPNIFCVSSKGDRASGVSFWQLLRVAFTFVVQAGEKGLTTEGTEEHRGMQALRNGLKFGVDH
jgi:hypothetical protein